MRALRLAVPLLAILLTEGCLASTVVVHVNADGSGRVTMTSRLYLSGMRAFDALFAAQGTAPTRPPQAAEELPAPGEGALRMAFGPDARLVSTRLDTVVDGGTRTTEIAFDDIRKVQMPFPPVGLGLGGGRMSTGFGGSDGSGLMTFSIRAHENGDRLLVVSLPNPASSSRPDDPITVFQTDSPEERLFKDAIKNMSLQLFVELEQPLLRTNAPRQEGNRATILDLNLDRMINAMDETRARRLMGQGSFQEILWQVGDLPGAMVPAESEIVLEYEGPAPQQAPAPPPAAQAPPDTEIYLAPLSIGGGRIVVGTPANITNNPGYDNQPFFTPDGRSILFASMRGASTPPQTDIYRYDLSSRAIVPVTHTPESEYSPTVMLDGERISVIRVEADGTQRLASVAPSGPKVQIDVILPDVKPVGYHAWADDHTLALFILGANRAPATLQLADTRTGQARVIATDVGRSIQRMPGTGASRHVSFTERERTADSTFWDVKELDPSTGAVTPLAGPIDRDAADLDTAWTPDGMLLAARAGKLYAFSRGASEWKEVASLEALGLRGVTRLAVSPKGDWLALVAAPQRSATPGRGPVSAR
jgi:hypothetical protein